VELNNAIERRIKKIFKRSLLMEFVLYWLTGVAGYLSMLDATPSLFINRP